MKASFESSSTSLGLACHHGQSVTDEQKKPDQSTDGIARQSEHQCPGPLASTGPDPEPERLARLETNLVKDAAHANRLQSGRDQITMASGYPAGDDQQVGGESLLERGLELRRLVRGDRQRLRRGARFDRKCLKHQSIGIADLAGTGHVLGLDKLIAGRQDGHVRAQHVHLAIDPRRRARRPAPA